MYQDAPGGGGTLCSPPRSIGTNRSTQQGSEEWLTGQKHRGPAPWMVLSGLDCCVCCLPQLSTALFQLVHVSFPTSTNQDFAEDSTKYVSVSGIGVLAMGAEEITWYFKVYSLESSPPHFNSERVKKGRLENKWKNQTKPGVATGTQDSSGHSETQILILKVQGVVRILNF